jgi:hypothetical protein
MGYVNRKLSRNEDFNLFPALLAYCFALVSSSGKRQVIYGTPESPTTHAPHVGVDE